MDAVRVIEQLVGRRALVEYRPRHPADVKDTGTDIREAERVLGWRPEVAFEEGMARAVDWYRENRDWAREVEMG